MSYNFPKNSRLVYLFYILDIRLSIPVAVNAGVSLVSLGAGNRYLTCAGVDSTASSRAAGIPEVCVSGWITRDGWFWTSTE